MWGLWVEGELPELPGVAIVGTRRATAAGLQAARRIGVDLGRRGISVISGFAVGIDVAAHRGCIEVGGRTVAVLGCGLAVDYPRPQREFRPLLAQNGALVSEYAPTDGPYRSHFPYRNRIIASLARAVVVVEAGVESGALSTARWAVELGREVLAVPGSILGAATVGSNRLLRDGATPYLDVTDLADLFDRCGDRFDGADVRAPQRITGDQAGRTAGAAARSEAGGRPGAAATRNRPAGIGERLLSVLGSEAVEREQLGLTLGIGAAELAVLVGEMELAGLIRSLAGGRVTRASQ